MEKEEEVTGKSEDTGRVVEGRRRGDSDIHEEEEEKEEEAEKREEEEGTEKLEDWEVNPLGFNPDFMPWRLTRDRRTD